MEYGYFLGYDVSDPKPMSIHDFIKNAVNFCDKSFFSMLKDTLSDHPEFMDTVNRVLNDTSHDNDENPVKRDYYFYSFNEYMDFVDNVSKAFTEKTGLNCVHFLSDFSQVFKEVDDLNQYDYRMVYRFPLGKELGFDNAANIYEEEYSAKSKVFGYPEPPDYVPVTEEEIKEAVKDFNLVVDLDEDIKLSDQDVQDILTSHFPQQELRDIVFELYEEEARDLIDQNSYSLFEKLPMISIIDAENFLAGVVKLPLDHYEKQPFNVLVQLADDERPMIMDMNNNPVVRSGSSAEWLIKELGGDESVVKRFQMEFKNFDSDDKFLITFPVTMTVKDIMNRDPVFKIRAGGYCGFFNRSTGANGNITIPVIKEIQIPREKLRFHIDSNYDRGFKLSDVWGLDKPQNKYQKAAVSASR